MTSPSCPLCRERLTKELTAGFFLCRGCGVAVRDERAMPGAAPATTTYDAAWVKREQGARSNRTRARFASRRIRNLTGVATVLDVGCGTGILVDLLARQGLQADGIDTAEEAVRFARANRKGRFFQRTIEDHVPQRCYDVLIATQLIEHLRDPRPFLAQVQRLLCRDGYLVLESPNLKSWNRRSLWRRKIGGMDYGIDHRVVYTSRSLARILEQSGFRMHTAITRTYPPTILVELIRQLRGFYRKRRGDRARSAAAGPDERVTRPWSAGGRGGGRGLSGWLERLADSPAARAAAFIPNRLSELRGRGNHIFVIARRVRDGTEAHDKANPGEQTVRLHAVDTAETQ